MAQEPASLNLAEESANDVFHLLKLLGHNTIYVDQHGDLDLVVGTGEVSRSFCVSSKVMRLASPVWRAMLSPDYSFIEASNRTSEVTFPEDNPTACFLLLLASHLRAQDMPERLDFKQMVDLCVLCDKYDCITILMPWLPMWMSHLKIHATQAGYEELSLIAWVVCDEELFKRVTEHIALTCKTDESKQCITSSGDVYNPTLPSELVDTILRARNAILTEAVKACHSMVDKYNTSEHRLVCRASGYQEQCDNLVFGTLVRHLQRLKLWPGKIKTIVCNMKDRSAEAVLKDIAGIRNFVYPSIPGGPHGHAIQHTSCPSVSDLHKAIALIRSNTLAEVFKLFQTRLNIRKQKLRPSVIHVSRFRARTSFRRS